MNNNQILFYSTNHEAKPVTFKEALLKGLAPDKGLFMPSYIPHISANELDSFRGLKYYQLAYEIIRKFLQSEIDDEKLADIARDAYNFDVPLELVFERKYVLRLDQGPTASFKDFAARMMGRLMQYFLAAENRNMLILTATSGDTGSAIANAFYGLNNIKVVILFPEKEVTDRQRKQMTTLNKNIKTIALDGKFDDCQALVKKAFIDKDLDFLNLSSANSINIGRLLPQSVYYFWAYLNLSKNSGEEIVISVPSGNFGNLMGGLIAKHMGLPVRKFIVSTNENDEVPEYFRTNIYKLIIPSINCISSAMNVGHPSNMARIIELYGGQMNEKGEILKEPDLSRMKKDMFAVSINDDDTKKMIKEAWDKYKLLLEPHGAVSWYGLMRYLSHENLKDILCVSLETAHPAKFPSEINELLGFQPKLPASMIGLDEKPEIFEKIPSDYNIFKEFLIENYR
jgi:threonine synthase